MTIDGFTELVQNLIPIFIYDGFGCALSVTMLVSLLAGLFNVQPALIPVRTRLPVGPKHPCSDSSNLSTIK